MPYVYSTLTSATKYDTWTQGNNGLSINDGFIKIEGGAGVASANKSFTNFITLDGVVTKVSDDELALLEKHEIFQGHMKRGFIRIERTKTDPEKVAADMASRDGSAPRVPQDFELSNKKPPKSGGK